ncbi:hypothetical protein ENUP19_0054G0068 [Entamoeba nuttalli]|uniref:Ubiquitin-like domain-containing protein n=1 Tax=Entamoeba nuttalli TaxID=412467 RepID=A0ABQ0DCB9_9EUKA
MSNVFIIKIPNPISGDFFVTMKEENTLQDLVNAIRESFNARGTKIHSFSGPVRDVSLSTPLKEMGMEHLLMSIINETEYSKKKKMSPKEYSEVEKPKGRKTSR